MKITGKPEKLAMELFKLDKEKIYEIKEFEKLRGSQANKYFHKQINQLARYERGLGHAISDEEMKIEINLQYGTIATSDNGKVIGAKVPTGTDIKKYYPYSKWYKKDEDDCDCYIFYKRTSELNTKEMSDLIRGLDVECQKVGIETLEEREFRLMMEKYEEERNKNGKKRRRSN